ncbi:hypothetical protein KCP70_23010 [Salmonella enterica subsp. enterica]|nr:hypothetical protein KCP70_23010 [Salmonella enterica subsp. enterica]
MVIGAPPAPSALSAPGLFSADLVPVMRITATTDTSLRREGGYRAPGEIG